MRTAVGVIMGIMLLASSGCSWFNTPDRGMEKSAETLVNEGIADYKKGNYRNAVQAFTTLRDWYPFSRYAILAELKIADAHYKLKAYEEALFAYEEFETLHPRNEALPYVIYRMGMCWYNKIPSVDKDQTPATRAMDQFQRLISRFPQDKYSAGAKKKIKRCMANLAGHESYVAEYYFKTGQYKAALKRYEHLFAHYPDTRPGKNALKQISRCREMLQVE